VLAVPSLCELYPRICLTTEEKARKNLSQSVSSPSCDRPTTPSTASSRIQLHEIKCRSCKKNQIGAQFFLICLLHFSTCFGKLCAHHQEKVPHLCDTWYLSLYMDDCLACSFIPPSIPDSHPYRITSNKCRTDTVISPDDGHIVAKNV
jgi:hypothetical protein